MNCIFVNYQPFSVGQKVSVYQNNIIVTEISVPLERVNETIEGFVQKYDINRINMIGSRQYLEQFKAELLTKYSNRDIDIHIV